MPEIVTIMGPTASGKTAVAAHLADKLSGVVLSGDSRQVYRGLDIGTGKDLDDYVIGGKPVPYFLIDICEAGERYNIHRYKQDFYEAYDALPAETPKILCGGSGLYIEAILDGYHIPDVAEDSELRERLQVEDLEELIERLRSYGPLHNKTDIESKQRVIRAIEIAEYKSKHPEESDETHREALKGPIFVIDISRESRRMRISKRLEQRLQGGLVAEVERLLHQGLTPEQLIYYGLEYKYVTEYLLGHYTYDEMQRSLEVAIHQFAKRQMTWIRGMERRGHDLTFVTPEATPDQTADKILALIRQND